MKTLIVAGLSVFAILVGRPAFALDKAACFDAASQGQTLRDAHKLIEARDKFRACAQQQCPGAVQSDCIGWLDAVEKSMPTVVVSAKDDAGADLQEVRVSADGQVVSVKLDGQAVPMNPGPHSLHFEASDGRSLDEEVVVKEGGKNQAVAVVLHRSASKGVSLGSSVGTQGVGDASSAWKTVGWVVGGVGAAGLVVGGIFGALAIGDKDQAHCDANNYCDAGPIHDAKTAAAVSDVGLIAGGVLFATGAALVIFTKSAGHEDSVANVKLVPTLSANGGGVMLGGQW